uniref:Uncharacterized protein n=1 Tax=Magallana gigas TaxID=29159 RepID=A0A8W8M0P6_MAGGI
MTIINKSCIRPVKFVDCPAGYFGHNCSDMCTQPSYGIQCGQKCNCTACHHIFGCNLTTEIPEIGTATVKHKRSNELQSAKNSTHQKLPGKLNIVNNE